ncbi:MAG: CDP-alcohol phosphatidyltransferase family protein, partial [Candidatus Omnitrophica bacterium]|nr:CDP-alcohol phosphatidyltransferase family protein [Candidatus Omnitrophota bacterium]
DSVIYIGILAYFSRSSNSLYVILTVAAMTGSLIVSYVRAKAESLGLACEVGVMPRAVRIATLGAAFCFRQVFWGLLIISVLTHFTVFQRIVHINKQLSRTHD